MKKQTLLKILLVEDDPILSFSIGEYLKEFGLLTIANDYESAQSFLKEQFFDVCFIDLWLHDEPKGLSLIEKSQSLKFYPIALSSSDDDDIITKAYESGAKDYLIKDKFKDGIKNSIKKFRFQILEDQNSNFFEEVFITKSSSLRKNIKHILRNNFTDRPLLLEGPTGVGKTKLAESLHYRSMLSGKFVNLNCSEIPENLIESELFGHEKGAFTGADQKKDGRIFLANNGTLFLDEIACMPIAVQRKLLKVLEEKKFYPLGAEKPLSSNFRLISATCENLDEKIKSKLFREDLFYRICGERLAIPALKDRPEDIQILIKEIIKESGRRIVFTSDALTYLKEYSWPGNIRELKNIIKILIDSETGIIEPNDLPGKILNEDEKLNQPFLTGQQENYIKEHGLKEFFNLCENNLVEKFLKKNNGLVRPTMKDLKITSTIFYKIQRRICL